MCVCVCVCGCVLLFMDFDVRLRWDSKVISISTCVQRWFYPSMTFYSAATFECQAEAT